MREVAAVQQRPIHPVQLLQIREVIRHSSIGVAVREYERNMKFRYLEQRRNQDYDFLIRKLWNPAIPCPDVVHHDGKWREIKGDIVTQRPNRRNGNHAAGTFINQIGIPDIPVIGIEYLSASSMQSIVENPREVVPVNNAKNQRFGRTEAHYLLVSFYGAAPGVPANHARQKALVAASLPRHFPVASLPRQNGGVKPPLPSSVARTCYVGPRLLGSNPRVMTGRSSRSIYAQCCAQAVVNGTAEHGWGGRTADLKNRSALRLLGTLSLEATLIFYRALRLLGCA